MNTINTISKSIHSNSSTVLELIHMYMDAYPKFNYVFASQDNNNPSSNFTIILEIKGTVIAFESHSYSQKESEIRILSLLNQHNPHLLVCACESNGKIVESIVHITESKSYNTQYIPVDNIPQSNALLHHAKAQHIKDLIQNMELI